MIISKYGVKLIRLRQEDLEFVRQKRNSEEIRRFIFNVRDARAFSKWP